eukprot:5358385-Alexandrium_andersonii.AAC.1
MRILVKSTQGPCSFGVFVRSRSRCFMRVGSFSAQAQKRVSHLVTPSCVSDCSSLLFQSVMKPLISMNWGTNSARGPLLEGVLRRVLPPSKEGGGLLLMLTSWSLSSSRR